MSGFTLRDDGYAGFKKILHGRKWVGRVARTADGQFIARIRRQGQPDLEATQPTEIAAFEQVAAEALGWPSASALRNSNARIRRAGRQRRKRAQFVVGEMLRGNYEPFDAMLGLKKEESK